MTAWCTKYALSSGVFVADAQPARTASVNAVMRGIWCRANEWHRTEDAALKRVAEMVAAARKGLAKKEKRMHEIATALASGALPMEKAK